MAGRRRIGVWLLRALAVLIIGGLAVYLYAVGLDKADKLASALSLVVAVIVGGGALVCAVGAGGAAGSGGAGAVG